MSDKLTLRTTIGKYDHVRPIWQGSVTSSRFDLNLVAVDPLPNAFRQMVRGLEFDLCEMALTTFAMAHAQAKPITALPIPLWRHFHHNSLMCAANSPLSGAAGLAGRKVGVRAYSQTTGVWLRGIMETEYGLDLDNVTWVTLEDAHVAEYRDPPNVIRAQGGKTIDELLLSGEVDAVMGLRKADPALFRTVIPNADAEAAAWYQRTGVFPINHVMTVKTELLEQHPWLAGEITSLFTKAKTLSREEAGNSAEPDMHPYGVEPNRASMQMLLDFSARQKLTPRAYGVDEIFSRTLTA